MVFSASQRRSELTIELWLNKANVTEKSNRGAIAKWSKALLVSE